MNKILILSTLILALAGCASTPNQPPAVPIEVKVPVPVPCKIDAPEAPEFAVDELPLGSDIWDQMAALRAERLQRQGYEDQLKAAIGVCQ